ncbi:hypothetical protein [Paucibacter soli]|uniref:hypothetical protein n=1 Tax=Paucibacter soli TaxID=3133433 RepID=UPI0030A9172D
MNKPLIGPGEGALIGLAWAGEQDTKDFKAERARLRQELQDASRTALGAAALKDAAKAVLNEVVNEIAAEQAGTLKVRRLSDPANIKGRNEAFADTATGQLKRLSDGAVQFAQGELLLLKSAKHEVSTSLRQRAMTPRVAPQIPKSPKK